MPGPRGLRGHPSMVRPVGRGLDPSAGRLRRRESPRVVTRGRAAAQAPAGRRGRRPLRVARERAAAGGRPSSGPAGPPSPKGEGKGCRGGIHPSRGVCGSANLRGASGTPPPTDYPGTGSNGRSRRGECAWRRTTSAALQAIFM